MRISDWSSDVCSSDLTDDDARGLRVVDGGGRVLAPGFIDLHTHGDPLEEAYTSFLAMGVTTVLLGQDGGSPSLRGERREAAGLSDYLDAVAGGTPAINVATLDRKSGE